MTRLDKHLFHKNALGMCFLRQIITSARIILLPTIIQKVSFSNKNLQRQRKRDAGQLTLKKIAWNSLFKLKRMNAPLDSAEKV